MPPRAKKPVALERSSNNSQGLVPPGKRIARRKSENTLNGHPQSPNGLPAASLPAASPIDLPTTAALPPEAALNGTLLEGKMGAANSQLNGRIRGDSDGSVDDLEAHGSASYNGHASNGSPLKIDVNAAGNGALRPQKGTLALAKTVITTCPLVDVIAMLILLLQLPTGIISIVHFLFAAITFMPTSATTSLSNMPSIREFLADSAGGPTVPVIVILDAIFFVIFLMLMAPLQNITLDLAQAVVAIAFSGAAASKGGPTNSILTCAIIIGMSHLLRWKPARQLCLSLFWTGLIRAGFKPIGNPPELLDYPDKLQMPPGWPRSLLGVHILVQGMVRLVRRYLLWRDALNAATTSKGKVDPESGSSSNLNTPRTNSSIADSNADTASSTSTDGRPPGPSPAAKDGKERVSSNRKKKKHASQVRSQQPFWAAIASTKVTFLKEYEQSQVFTDLVESEGTENSRIANFKGADRVWIKGIGPTEICFGACLMRSGGKDQERTEQDYPDVTDVSASKPFYIKVNGADWSSIKMQSPERNIPCGDAYADVWTGRIFGLNAYSPYHIEFVRLEDDNTICATNLITQPAPSAEQGTSSSVQITRLSSDMLQVTVVPASTQTLRPSSPTTTLKNSILAAEQQLESQRNKLKRAKKEHKTATSSIQKDVDSLAARLNSSGGNDERQRQKIRQLEQSIKRAEETAAELEKQIKEYGDIPEHELEEAATKRAAWLEQKDHRAACKKELEACKAEADRELAQVQSELATAQQKHQRFQQRQAKYSEQHENLVSATAQGHEAQARRYIDREYLLAQRRQQEDQLITLIEADRRHTQELLARAAQTEAQVRHLQDLYARATSQAPTTPEGPLPGTRGSTGNAHLHIPFTTFQFPAVTAPSVVDSLTMPTTSRTGRGRSSSMLSNVSNFTDGLDEGSTSNAALPPFGLPPAMLNGGGNGHPLAPLWSRRKSSNGSGSGSGSGPGSNTSSQRDPTSPAPQAKALSPTASVLPSPISPPGGVAAHHLPL